MSFFVEYVSVSGRSYPWTVFSSQHWAQLCPVRRFRRKAFFLLLQTCAYVHVCAHTKHDLITFPYNPVPGQNL